jgi:hypothetical protein
MFMQGRRPFSSGSKKTAGGNTKGKTAAGSNDLESGKGWRNQGSDPLTH